MCQQTEDVQQEVKVDKWDGAAVRNALDDEVRCIVTHDYRMEEDHSLPDGRLAISVLAVAAAGWALLWDWWHPFPESRPVLVACVLSYFALMGILTLYTNYYEKGIFVVAKRKDEVGLEAAKVFTVRSTLDRFDDMYRLEMTMHVEGQKSTSYAQLEKSISSWFDTNGVLRKDLLRKDVDKLHRSLLDGRKASIIN
ncbi:probable signal peptidase complex subunit 2 [Varroa jacobsoni]|uniref:Signal peptidase complex subunit 2 n=1 Tax=Varroa destructor TaxID=109461 RepID=A0A7M7KYI2_VARDE|nr:signal peptidase complex subunit 2-like [Varroa destructor]XP_022710608.1 probable signal peptidase complex subunit 2 [Varroa jacobsoni]